jgi:AcrR family transcriptional regulator
MVKAATGAPARPKPKSVPRDVLEGFRRERIVLAIAELTHEGGSGNLTTTRILSRGRMSRKTFYELFGSKDGCMTYASQLASAWLVEPISAACDASDPGPERHHAAIEGLLQRTVANPLLAEFCLVHSPALTRQAEPAGSQAPVEALATALAGPRNPPPERATFVASAIISVVASRLRRDEPAQLADLGEELALLATKLLGR